MNDHRYQYTAAQYERLQAENARLRNAEDAIAPYINELKAENDRLREALEPFATCWTDEELDGAPDNAPIEYALHEASQPTVGDLRRARAALAKEAGK